MLRNLLLILAGLLSAPLMEVGSVVWMRILPGAMDLTASYFAMVVLPVALVLHFLSALLLWKAFEPAPKKGGTIYLTTHIVTQATVLSLSGNPVMDVLSFCVVLLLSGSLMLFVFNRYFWCPQCTGPV